MTGARPTPPSRLTVEQLVMPAAAVGPESPLPPLPGATDVHATVSREGVPDEIARDLGYGFPPCMLPYRVQDGYDRHRTPREFPSIVLENEVLRAVFLPSLGGRLASLTHLPSGRELLYRNPVLQPANLALRNAWFSGGVEWNLGTTGHTPLTCAPMFAARVSGPDGVPVLRMWEFERLREVVYQLDCWLPPGSPVLYVAVRIVNPHDCEIPMYWWSNIAVPQRPGVRVLAPASSSYRFSYERRLTQVPAPVHGYDYSYPAEAPHAADFFFRVDDGRPPWIAALDTEGRGLGHASTSRLLGRKLFVWGGTTGGRHWQEFLSAPGSDPYLEIQAGLARTQMQHVAMPAGATWTWLEAYGLVEADAAVVHGDDWTAATTAAQDALADIASPGRLDATLARWQPVFGREPVELLHLGSGWGALERQRRATSGAPWRTAGTPFGDETLGPMQAPWLALLHSGGLPPADPQTPPGSYATSTPWRALLELAASRPGADWLTLYHLGTARCAHADLAGAREAFTRSVAHTPSAWALRALGWLDHRDGRSPSAAEHYLQAHALAPGVRQLAVEAVHALLGADRADEALDLIDGLPPQLRGHGRVLLVEARAALAAGQLPRASAVLAAEFEIADLREGEDSLSTLWFDIHEKLLAQTSGQDITDEIRDRVRREHPLPAHYDFRMR